MNIIEIGKIKKLYFGCDDIARSLGISHKSALVAAARYVRQKALVRFKRNCYLLPERWRSLTDEERFLLANMGQVPSYISLMTAMMYHNLTTQVQRDFTESVAVKRTKAIEVEGAVFNYCRIDKRLYRYFYREKGFFIAGPEKAFLDAAYLASFGRYRFDTASIDKGRLDKKVLLRLSKGYPERTIGWLEKHGYIKKV